MDIEVTGDFDALLRFRERMHDLRGLMARIGEAMVTSTKLRFEDQVGPDGARWPPSLRALREGGQTLRDRGRLMGSITYDVDGPDSVVIGPSIGAPQASALQFGAVIEPRSAQWLVFQVGDQWVRSKRVVIPPRPYIGVSESDADDVRRIVGEWVTNG